MDQAFIQFWKINQRALVNVEFIDKNKMSQAAHKLEIQTLCREYKAYIDLKAPANLDSFEPMEKIF